jgi:aminomethyltransferase
MELPPNLKNTPLYALHNSLGAKMVPFAGYQMPVQYPSGIIKEHLHTRTAAGLFDISHMGQILLEGGHDIRLRVESVLPCDVQTLQPGQIRYSMLLTDQGGVIDDLMVTAPGQKDNQNSLFMIVNASGRDVDLAYIQQNLPDVKATLIDNRALLALQGPESAVVLQRYCDAPNKLRFMQAGKFQIDKIGECWISRSGYTGEDGFEISVPNESVELFATQLLAQPEVLPIGLGARDSLRLEAGLCLYGHDLSTDVTPIEANLTWAISKRRREEGGFIGAPTLQKQLREGVTRKLVGLCPQGRALAREQTAIVDQTGRDIGQVTSGGFGASFNGPICMGYVETSHAKKDTIVGLVVRGQTLPAKVVSLPFVQHRYVKG